MTLEQLISDTLLYLEQQPRNTRLFAPKELVLQATPAPSLPEPILLNIPPPITILPAIKPQEAPEPIQIYRNNLKNREFGKEGPQNLHSEQGIIAERQGPSENANCEVNPTWPKTDSSGCFGIRAPIRQTQHPIRQTLLRIEPTLTLFDHPPPDTQAEHIASGWKEWMPGIQIVILLLHKAPSETVWIQNLARAMHNKWGGVKILHARRLEQEKRWDLFFLKNDLRLILLSAGSLDTYPELLKYYKSIPAQALARLNEIPTLHLQAFATYTPEEKRLLWQKVNELLC